MSRYKLRVRQADSLHGAFACDAVHVDGGGDLHVNRLCGGGGSLTIARFQHGHWSSYELELSGDAEPDTDTCAEAPVKAEALPEVGDRVHLLRRGDPCMDVYIGAVHGDGTVLLMAHPDKPWRTADRIARDSPSHPQYSWHWPCDSDGQHAEPEPDAPAPISVTFNFDTPVLNERWLRESVDRALRQATSVAAWTPYRR